MSYVLAMMVLFVAATVVSHLAYLVLRTALQKSPPKSVWIFVDYVWISALVVTLATSAAQARVTLQPDYLRWHEGWTQSQFESTQFVAVSAERYFCEHAADESWTGEAGRAAFERACAWFTEMADALEGGYDSPAWGDFLDEHRQDMPDDDGVVQSGKKHAIGSLERLEKQYAKLEEERRKAEFSSVEKLLLGVWPPVLALSLAVRLTRVTAELLQQSTWATNDRPNMDR